MKEITVKVDANIEVDHHRIYHKKGELMLSCGKECKKKHCVPHPLVFGMPICTLFGQETGKISGKEFMYIKQIRCIKCFQATEGKDLTTGISMDREVMICSVINIIGSKPANIEKIVDTFLETGKVHHKSKAKLKKLYNFDLEMWFDNYLESSYNLFRR